MRLLNKVALVTGSTSGIGKAVANTLSREGAKVAIHGLEYGSGQKIVDSIRENGSEAILITGDLMEQQTPPILVKQVIEQWGQLDILVNCAGIIQQAVIGEVTHNDWDRVFMVNLKAPFFLIQEALPFLKACKGAVINISSLNAIRNTECNFIYDSIKAALNHMTRGLALDLKGSGVRFNTVMPAGTATPLLVKAMKENVRDSTEAEKKAEQLFSNNPTIASPQQIANIVLFLASSEASWINGADIRADGGIHL